MGLRLVLIVTLLIGVNAQDTQFLCDFEDDASPFCGMVVGGSNPNLMTRRADATPSEQTGPDFPQSGRYYVHLEVSGTQATDYAELTRTNLALNSGCLRFYYHMYDAGSGDVNSMRAEVFDGATWSSVFQKQGNQGNEWKEFRGDVGRVNRLRFTLYSNGQYRGDIGLDNISLVSGTCSSPGQQQAPPPAPQPPPSVIRPPDNLPPRPAPAPAQPPAPASEGSACPQKPMKMDDPRQPKQPKQPPMMGNPHWLLAILLDPKILHNQMFQQMMGSQMKDEDKPLKWAMCEKYMATFPVVLVGGQNASYGRVEILYNGTWGTVCNDRFTDKEAQAVCKSAGFYGGRIMTNVPQSMQLRSGDPKRIWLDGVKCYEGSRLQECGRNEWGVTDCTHDRDAFVMCDPVPEQCKEMDLKINDTVDGCMAESMMDDARARDYASRDSKSRGLPPHGPWSLFGIDWGMMGYGGQDKEDKSDDSMQMKRDCHMTTPFTMALVSGSYPWEGRVEVYLNGSWGTVCNDKFGPREAQAVCRSMGYFGGKVMPNPPLAARLSRNDPQQIWLDGVKCGEGSSLKECCRNEWGVNDCNHDQDVFVSCDPMPMECMRIKEERNKKPCASKEMGRDGRSGMASGGMRGRDWGREMRRGDGMRGRRRERDVMSWGGRGGMGMDDMLEMMWNVLSQGSGGNGMRLRGMRPGGGMRNEREKKDNGWNMLSWDN